MTENKALDPRFDNNIDFLRLLAAIGVVFGHAFAFAGAGDDPVTRLLGSFSIPYLEAIHGISVWFLFYISGNLVSASYAHRESLKDYALSRFLRIYPGLFVVITASVLACAFITTLPLSEYFTDKQTWKYFTRNILGFSIKYELPGVFQDNPLKSVNGSLWTIPLELRLYIVVAVLGVLGFFKRPRILAALLGVLILVQVGIQDFGLYERSRVSASPIPLFLIGALFFCIRDRLPVKWIWLAALAIIWFPLKDVPIAGHALLVLGFCYAFHLISKIPRIPCLNVGAFGDYSYGVYLWSAPIQQVLVWYGVKSGWMIFGYSLILSLIAGIASWHFIENKALQLKRRSN